MHPTCRRMAVLFILLTAPAASLAGQQPVSADSMRQGLRALTARLDSLEAGQCPPAPLQLPVVPGTGNAATDSLSAAMQTLARRMNAMAGARCEQVTVVMADSARDDLASLREAAAGAAGGVPETAPADTGAGPQFVSLQRNLNKYNPEISATGDIRLVARDENPQRDNGIAREFELAFQSNLDPYSATKIYLTFEDEEIGVEEGYIYYSGLPGKLRVDLGKFRQELGDLNRWHLHALPETEYPLVYQRYLSPEGLSGVGLSLYTVLPFGLAGGTHELWLQGTTTSELDPLLAGSRQPLGLARIQNFWQLTRSTYAQVGFTGMLGENTDSSLTSNLTGADFRFTWRPPNAGTRRDLTLRLEGYRLHANLAGTVTNRYGMFADAQFKMSRRWTIGGRYDYVEAARGPYADEWRITPALTWWQSEFVYLRLQGQHRRDLDGATRNDLTLQAVWAMGPHKHETY